MNQHTTSQHSDTNDGTWYYPSTLPMHNTRQITKHYMYDDMYDTFGGMGEVCIPANPAADWYWVIKPMMINRPWTANLKHSDIWSSLRLPPNVGTYVHVTTTCCCYSFTPMYSHMLQTRHVNMDQELIPLWAPDMDAKSVATNTWTADQTIKKVGWQQDSINTFELQKTWSTNCW